MWIISTILSGLDQVVNTTSSAAGSLLLLAKIAATTSSSRTVQASAQLQRKGKNPNLSPDHPRTPPEKVLGNGDVMGEEFVWTISTIFSELDQVVNTTSSSAGSSFPLANTAAATSSPRTVH